jgi:hypothetical protein
MDKHERPYRCAAEGCEKLPGFTYSGGLLRHEREVHGKHGGPKNTVNCPYANCKRHTGKGFSRQENLNEHLRRVHTNENTFPPKPSSPHEGGIDDATVGNSEDDSDKAVASASGGKRKRGRNDSTDLSDLREEIKRVRQENEDLRQQLDRHGQHALSMVDQIAELQEALRIGTLASSTINAPATPMI